MNATTETLLCGCTSGAIFVRPCPNPAVAQCARCQCPLCRDHARFESSGPPVMASASALCPACHAESRTAAADDVDDGGATWTADASRAHWHESSGHYGSGYTVSGGDPFTSDDYDAFDAVSDYDKDAEQGDGYDS